MQRPESTRTQRLCADSLLAAAALIIFVVEAQIPVPVAIPGLKLGLANVVTLYMLCTYPLGDAFAVLMLRIILGSIFAGQAMSFMFSLVGGILAFGAMKLYLWLARGENIWFAGIVGAIVHNLGQISVAVAVYRSGYVAYYLAVLLFCGVVTGLLTGLVAQLLAKRRLL